MYCYFRSCTWIQMNYLDVKNILINKTRRKFKISMVAWWAFIQILYIIYILGGRGVALPCEYSTYYSVFHTQPFISWVWASAELLEVYARVVPFSYFFTESSGFTKVYSKISWLPGEFWWKCILPWWKVQDVWPCDNLGVLLLLNFKTCFTICLVS